MFLACETNEPTEASIVNGFPNDEPDPYTIVKVWCRTTPFLEPVAPGQESETLRVGTGTEPVYAIVARGFAPNNADAGAPKLVAARTRDVIMLSPGETERVLLSPATALVGCGGAGGLSKADYEFIATRIFPGDALVPFNEAGCGDLRSPGVDSGAEAAAPPDAGDVSGE
jgi:hypothetical protein